MTRHSFVALLLRTPFYFFLGNTMLITVIGRKSGRKYTTPVGFYREGDFLWIISSRNRTWWRNLKGCAQVRMRLRGRELIGRAEAVLDEDEVAALVGDYIRHVPIAARALGVCVEDGKPSPEDAARLAKERLFVRIQV